MWEHGVPDSKIIVLEQTDDFVCSTGVHYARYLCTCQCDTNKRFVADPALVKSGRVKSCGCLSIENKKLNGRTLDKRLRSVLNEIKQRCLNPNCPAYKDYGGRGISVCDEWRNDYTAFKRWALSLGYDHEAERGKYTVERINNDGNYCPENCMLVSMKEQANNRREKSNALKYTVDGETHTIKEWCNLLNITRNTLCGRIRNGRQIEDMNEYKQFKKRQAMKSGEV